MPIQNPSPPADGINRVRAFLSELVAEHGPGILGLRSRELGIADPHVVYVVSLSDLAEGRLLEAARPVGWRYVILDGDDPIGEVEQSIGHDPEPFSYQLSPFSGASFDAIITLEDDGRVGRADYELRFLKLPALHLVGVWAHGNRRDLLILLGETPIGLKSGTIQLPGTVRRVTRRLALDAVAFERIELSGPQGPGFDG